MIRHIVLLKPKLSIDENALGEVWRALLAVGEYVPMISAEWGRNISPENLDRGYSAGFTMDFADSETRDAYLVHPAHKAAAEQLVALLDGGVEGVLVFDFDIQAG